LGVPGDAGLVIERTTLLRLAGEVCGAVTAPSVRWHGQWHGWTVVATSALERRTKGPPVGLEDALAAACALAGSDGGFLVHGDLAPWNMIPTSTGLAVVDWETSRFENDPFVDLAHFVTSTGGLLGAWPAEISVAHLVDRGGVGWRYLEATGLDPHSALTLLERYLRSRQGDVLSPAPRRHEAEMMEAIAGRSRTNHVGRPRRPR
jgi:aminoglycoside phosphotransferase (APT) family kinase protein